MTAPSAPFEIVDLACVPGVRCPCGLSRRAFAHAGPDSAPAGSPASLHRVEISADARAHYHKRLTEIYYFLECEGACHMELNGKQVPVKPGMAILIRPLTRHRAVGRMTLLNVVVPPFDEADEWFD